jgi:hypothetical protein
MEPELASVVVEFLIRFWMEQGLTQDRATAAAQNALVRLQANISDETWVLLPIVVVTLSPM